MVKSCFWLWSKNLTVFKKYWTCSKKFERSKDIFELADGIELKMQLQHEFIYIVHHFKKITTAFCTAHKPPVHFSESSATWLGWWDILGPRAKMLLAVKNRGQKNPQLLHRHQNSKNCTHYYSPRVLLIYKNNMHKKIKTNSCFPKK